MKRIVFFTVVISMLTAFSGVMLQAQDTGNTRRTPQMSRGGDRNRQNRDESGLPELTVRAQHLNEQLTQNIGNARWMRVIYRELNMLEEKNAPLYYPVNPRNGSMNLFSSIFQLVSEGKLKAYEYIDGYEAFDEDHLVDFKSVLDRFTIMYETVPERDGRQRFVINESDVPSGEVKAFYVKEAWYFDQNNSLYDVKTLAISPIIFYEGDMGTERSPMFWVVYEDVRPYVSNTYIMTSNTNNAKTFISVAVCSTARLSRPRTCLIFRCRPIVLLPTRWSASKRKLKASWLLSTKRYGFNPIRPHRQRRQLPVRKKQEKPDAGRP